MKADLVIDRCSFAAAKYAVEKWHYSGLIPQVTTDRFAVSENDQFVGCVLFGHGARSGADQYGLSSAEFLELTRVALTEHVTPTSRIVRIAIRLLLSDSPKLRLLVSYADSDQGHHGGIYQAMGWTYVGNSTRSVLISKGQKVHQRTNAHRGGMAFARIRDPNIHYKQCGPKRKYLLPLDSEMGLLVSAMAMPYPKRSVQIGADPSSTLVVAKVASPDALHARSLLR